MIRPEDEPEINEMTAALKLSKERSCILLVSLADDVLRQDVEAEIRRRLGPEGFNFRDVKLTEDGHRNLPITLVNMDPQTEDIFLIFGLKKALPEVLEYLNYRREDFVKYNISAVFWLDEFTLTQIAGKSPDFWAFRDRTSRFNVDRKQDAPIPGRTTLDDIFTYSSLEELDDKIAQREQSLKDYLETQSQDRLVIARIYNELGILYHSKSQFDVAITYYQKSLNLSRESDDKRREADSLNNIGLAYHDKGDLKSSLRYYSQALDVDRRIGNIQGEAFTLGNIGSVYGDKGDLEKALEHHSQALDIDRRIGDTQGEANTLNNMGSAYWAKGELDEALRYHSQALDIYSSIGHIRGEASSLGNMGLVYRDKGDLDKALECHSKALDTHRHIGYALGEAIQLANIGLMYQVSGALRDALTHIKEALMIFISTGAEMSADRAYDELRDIMGQIEDAGIELSEQDMREIAELTERYEKLNDEVLTPQADDGLTDG